MKLREIMTRKVLSVELSDSLEIARQTMLWGGFRHIPVMDGDAVVGIVSERDVLQAKGAAAAGTRKPAVCDVMRVPVETASPEASVEETAHRMAAKKIGAMPIVENGKLVGMVTTTDLLSHLGKPSPRAVEDSLPPVSALMTNDPIIATAGEPLVEAASRMAEKRVRHLPVVDADGHVTAILSDRDVLRAATPVLRSRTLGPGEAMRNRSVADAMTEDPFVLPLDASLEDAISLFAEHHVGAIPIVDDHGRLKGIVSYLDVLGWFGRVARGEVNPQALPH